MFPKSLYAKILFISSILISRISSEKEIYIGKLDGRCVLSHDSYRRVEKFSNFSKIQLMPYIVLRM